MLTRFRVQGFKSLLDVELQLAPLVVLMGPNAAGKSNLLEALLLLSRLATWQPLSTVLAPPLRGYPLEAFTLPEGGLEALLRQDRADLALEADVQMSQAEEPESPDMNFRMGVRIQPKTGALEVTGAYLNNQLVSEQTRTLAYNLLHGKLTEWQTYYLDPRVAMREPQPPREVTDIGPRGEWIAPFLHRLKESESHFKYFRAIGRALQQAIPTIESLDVDLDPRRGTLDIVIQQDGTPYSSRVVSEGTLRVLALCCLAANPWPGDLVAFEEPENGVHPRRIEVIADLLASMASEGKSQVVVTTHSPTLIAAMLQRAQENPGKIKLFRCFQVGRATQVKPFQISGPFLNDPEIRNALTGPEDAQVIEALLKRGWLDG